MKIREMFKKLESYNEMAELMGATQAHITFDDVETWTHEDFKNYKDFKKYLNENYFNWFVKPLIEVDSWEIDEEKKITVIDPFGVERMNTVTFFLYRD